MIGGSVLYKSDAVGIVFLFKDPKTSSVTELWNLEMTQV